MEQPATSGVDVDVTRYDPSSEKRKTLSDGIVKAEWARQQLDQGATIRLRQPQDRLTKVQALCRALEGEFRKHGRRERLFNSEGRGPRASGRGGVGGSILGRC